MKLRRIVLMAFVFSGMAALMYEVVWTRPLSLIFGSTIYAVSTILAVFMGGLAIGSYIMSRYADDIKNPPVIYSFIEMGIGIYGVILILIFNNLPSIYLSLYNAFHTQFYLFSFFQFLLIFFVLLIPTALMGATWPLIVKFYTDKKIGKGIGELYSANTLGAIIGSFAAGFILIPIIGVQFSIVTAALVNIIIGIVILTIASKSLAMKAVPVILIIFLVISLSSSYNAQRLTFGSFYYSHLTDEYIENTDLVFFKDGLYGTVSVLDNNGVRSLLINGKGEGGTSFTDSRTNYLLAYLPLLVHSYPESSLNIGLGTGITSGILSKYTQAETIEIDPEVIEASKLFSGVNQDVVNNPNHEMTIADARNHLRVSDKKYDVIVSEPADPWQSISTNLYSKEFYEIVENHLEEDGVFAQWVPIYELSPDDFRMFYNTFHSVFPHVIAFGNIRDEVVGEYFITTSEIILIGSKSKVRPDWDLIGARINQPEITEDLTSILINDLDSVKNLFYFTEEDMEGYGSEFPLITDDRPLLEFTSGQTIIIERNPTFVIEDIENYLLRGT